MGESSFPAFFCSFPGVLFNTLYIFTGKTLYFVLIFFRQITVILRCKRYVFIKKSHKYQLNPTHTQEENNHHVYKNKQSYNIVQSKKGKKNQLLTVLLLLKSGQNCALQTKKKSSKTMKKRCNINCTTHRNVIYCNTKENIQKEKSISRCTHTEKL